MSNSNSDEGLKINDEICTSTEYNDFNQNNLGEEAHTASEIQGQHHSDETDYEIIDHSLNQKEKENVIEEEIPTENDIFFKQHSDQIGTEIKDVSQNEIERVTEGESQNDTDELHEEADETESVLIDFIKRKEKNIVDDLLEDLENKNNWNINEEDVLEYDDMCESEEDIQAAERPVQPGHSLSLKTSVLLIWLFAITHSISSSELQDLLTLINLHLIVSNRAYQSVYRFKNFFANVKLPTRKHFFCHFCGSSVKEDQMICLNSKCQKSLVEKSSKSHFIELDVKSQLKNFFKRQDFLEGLKHRFYRSKKKADNIEDVYDSLLYKKLSENDGALSSLNNITFTVNTDGIPVFKSSKTSIWPIFLMINELPYKMRSNRNFMILSGLWYGSDKPSMNLFFDPLLQALMELEKGIEIEKHGGENVLVKAFMFSLSCDIPARSAVLNMNQHNGEGCCVKCTQPGQNNRTESGGNIRVFPFAVEDPDGPERSHERMLECAQTAINTSKPVEGIKGPSVLMFCPMFDVSKGVAIDYMHLICLGVVRLLLKLWFDIGISLKNWSLYRFLDIVDSRLENIKTPHFITRLPRTISQHLKFWKAAELRSWLLFYSVPCILDLMQPVYFYHYCAFLEGIYLLCQSSISPDDLKKSEQLLRYFVLMLPSLYDLRYSTINVHYLMHLPQGVRELGPLWSVSCFAFEGANGELLKLFHGTQFIDMQIVNAVHVFQMLPSLTEVITETSVAYKFVNSLVKQNSVIQDVLNFSLHGKPYEKNVSNQAKTVIIQTLGKTEHSLKFYNRATIRGVTYQSQDYTRVIKRNSYTVRFVDKGKINFGLILWFACLEELETSENKFAYVRKLVTSNSNLFEKNHQTGFVSQPLSDNFMNITMPHLRLMKVSEEEVLVTLKSILELCICIETDDCFIICQEPNHLEKNL